jgi:hypothetical protein
MFPVEAEVELPQRLDKLAMAFDGSTIEIYLNSVK